MGGACVSTRRLPHQPSAAGDSASGAMATIAGGSDAGEAAAAAGGAADAGAAADEENEAFYEEHRAVLLEHLRVEGPGRLQGRAEGGVGLLNQGATCYMNSLLQALFNTPEFKLMIYSFRHEVAVHGDAAGSIPLQLQRLFAQLQLSRASAVSTKDLTAACGFSSRDAFEQHDVQELCRILFDALEVSSAALAEAIQRLFAGHVAHCIRTKEEHRGRFYESRRSEKFLDLQVPIQGCKTLEEALRNMLVSEALDGDNQWHCEELGQKVDALKGLSFEQLPHILCLQLMRFVFDFVSMRRKKVDEAVSIPLVVDFGFLMGGGEALQYELMAICLHSGTAHGGHYRAFISNSSDGTWREANDAVVKEMDEAQTSRLFKARDPSNVGCAGGEAAPAEAAQPPVAAYSSADAYFLLYRRAGSSLPPRVSEADVPEVVRTEILAENAQVSLLERAYAIHKSLLEVRIFGPVAAHLALRKYATKRLGDLLGEEEEQNLAPEPKSVTLTVPRGRSVSYVMAKALSACAEEAAKEGDQGIWQWAQSLSEGAVAEERVRLRRFDLRGGDIGAPLLAGDNAPSVGDQLGKTGAGAASLYAEFREPVAEFQAWAEGRARTVICLWDPDRGVPGVNPEYLFSLRIASPGGDAKLTVAQPSAFEAEQDAEAPNFIDPEDPPDLFGPAPEFAPTTQGVASAAASPLVGEVRRAAAAAFGAALGQDQAAVLQEPQALALVALTGDKAGQALLDDGSTLVDCGVAEGDILCGFVSKHSDCPVEEWGPVRLYQEKRNTARFTYNHPDRPQYCEEFEPLAMSKDLTVRALKERIAQELGLDADKLHLKKLQSGPQLKDEAKSLREVGLADYGSVFVGPGAPCGPDENIVKVSFYTYDNGNHKVRDAFSLPAKATWSVKHLREAVVEPLLRWCVDDTVGGSEAPFSAEGLTWKRLRLRDGQAGKQFAILRDERAVRQALMGFSDGRQMAVQVLKADEELSPSDVILAVRPWRVTEGRLHAPTEIIVQKEQTLSSFLEMLTTRFKGLLQGEEQAEEKENSAEDANVKVFAEDRDAKMSDSGPDALEVVVVPTVGPALTVKRCETLKWAECRFNASASAEALMKPLSDLKEIRDGITLVVRSKLAALRGPPAEAAAPKAGGKGKGKGPSRPLGKAGAKSGTGPSLSTVVAAKKPPQAAERGLVIRVAHPEGPAPQATEAAATDALAS